MNNNIKIICLKIILKIMMQQLTLYYESVITVNFTKSQFKLYDIPLIYFNLNNNPTHKLSSEHMV